MCVTKFLTGLNIIAFLTVTTQSDHQQQIKSSNSNIERELSEPSYFGPLYKSNLVHYFNQNDDNMQQLSESSNINALSIQQKRKRRETSTSTSTSTETDDDTESSNNFGKDEIDWSIINEEVDIVIPLVLQHLQKLGIEHLELPEMKESISISPLFLTYEAGLFLSNGIVYNLAGIQRYGDAYMTYVGKSFLTKFYLMIDNLQFEYNFLLKLMAIEGYGKIIGSLKDTTIYAELAINVVDSKLKLNDFRIIRFSNIQVQLDQSRLIRQLTGVILSPITNLFKDRITTSIADGLKEQMQMIMDDFNNNDPLELRKFTKKLLAGLTGQTD